MTIGDGVGLGGVFLTILGVTVAGGRVLGRIESKVDALSAPGEEGVVRRRELEPIKDEVGRLRVEVEEHGKTLERHGVLLDRQ